MKIEIDINLKIDSQFASLLERFLSSGEKAEKATPPLKVVDSKPLIEKPKYEWQVANSGPKSLPEEKPSNSETKVCLTCEVPKPLDEFYNDTKTEDGKNYHCKVCWKKRYQKTTRKRIQAIPAKTSVKESKPEKKIIISAQQQKVNDNRRKEDEKIKSMVVICDCPRAEKIVKGLEIEYKGKIFYSDRCLEEFVNKDIQPGEGVRYDSSS